METTLQGRVNSKALGTTRTRSRWTIQTASTMAWLEKIGYGHGDLRPPDILLMADDNASTARELEEDEDKTNSSPWLSEKSTSM